MKKISALIVVLPLVIIFGCKKEDNYIEPPVVNLLEPTENVVYNVYDTIFVKANINHHTSLKEINLSVRDQDLKPVLPGKTLLVNDLSVTVDSYLVIDNKYMTEDEYFLLIEMIDNKDNEYKEWYDLNIQPLSREVENVLFVSGRGNQKELYMINAADDLNRIAAWNSEYLGGYIDSRYRQFYTAGSFLDGIRAYDIDEKKLNWLIPVQVSGTQPYFTSFSAVDGRVAAATREGIIECYNQNGIKTCNTTKRNNGKYETVLIHENFVMGIFTQFSANTKYLDVYNYPSGTLYQSLELFVEPNALVTVDEKTVMLIAESNSEVHSFIYLPADKSFDGDYLISNTSVKKVVGEDQNWYLLDSSGVKNFNPEGFFTKQIILEPGFENLTYDPEGLKLYLTKGNEIHSYILPQVSSDIFQANQQVIDVLLLYNR